MSKKFRAWSRPQRRAIHRRTVVAQLVAMKMRQLKAFWDLQDKVVAAERQAIAVLFGA